MTEVTRILKQIEDGDPSVADKLLPLVYDELRQLASRRLSQENPGQTLQATALVHEAYLRLVGNDQDQRWDGRGHFFAAASEAMRRILIDRARNKRRDKRGGGTKRQIDFDRVEFALDSPADDLLAVNDALEQLSQDHPACAELVKLRFFGGLSLAEAAEALGLARRTTDRHWAFARAWLYRELRSTDTNSG